MKVTAWAKAVLVSDDKANPNKHPDDGLFDLPNPAPHIEERKWQYMGCLITARSICLKRGGEFNVSFLIICII